MSRRYRRLSPVLVSLLLWGAMAFAMHTHHDEVPGSESECQVCLFASLSGSAVPQAVSTLTPVISQVSIAETSIEGILITPQIRTQEARAPPAIS